MRSLLPALSAPYVNVNVSTQNVSLSYTNHMRMVGYSVWWGVRVYIWIFDIIPFFSPGPGFFSVSDG